MIQSEGEVTHFGGGGTTTGCFKAGSKAPSPPPTRVGSFWKFSKVGALEASFQLVALLVLPIISKSTFSTSYLGISSPFYSNPVSLGPWAEAWVIEP